MFDGIYSIAFRSSVDWGIGMLLLRKGTITGADVAGVLFDGSYQAGLGGLSIKMTMTVPPGVTLVQGTPARPTQYTVPIDLTLPGDALQSQRPVLLPLPHGPVNVIFRKLRRLDD